MLYLTIIFVFLTVMLFSYFVLISINKNKIEMADRVTAIENLDKAWANQEEAYGESVGGLLIKSIGRFIIKFSPGYKSKKTKQLLEKAGILRETSAEKWVARKAIITGIVFLLMAILSLAFNDDLGIAFVLGLLSALIVGASYKFYISKKITKRIVEIIKSLPYTLDLITVSVEAGLSLDGAIGRIVGAINGPLSDEFGQTLKEMRMGIEKKIALKNMSARIGNRDLTMILSSIIQADELGVSLGKILRIEGDQLREKRKQIAREKAMKAPIKILFPLIIFIFPTIFLVVLGPAVISMVEMF